MYQTNASARFKLLSKQKTELAKYAMASTIPNAEFVWIVLLDLTFIKTSLMENASALSLCPFTLERSVFPAPIIINSST